MQMLAMQAARCYQLISSLVLNVQVVLFVGTHPLLAFPPVFVVRLSIGTSGN